MTSSLTLTMDQKDPYQFGQQLLIHRDGSTFVVIVVDPSEDELVPDESPYWLWWCLPVEGDGAPIQVHCNEIIGVVTPAPDLEGFDRCLRKMRFDAKRALAVNPGADMKHTEGMVMAYSISLILLNALRSGILEGGEA